MHQSLQGATFHVEHVIPRCLGGSSEFNNLAWACPSCNLHKSNRVAAAAPGVDEAVPLFNPRTDKWGDHFGWDGYHITGLTPVGRATIDVLLLNENGGLGFVKWKHCSISSPRVMSRHNHSPYGLTASSSSGLTPQRPRRKCPFRHPRETHLGSSTLMLKRASDTSTSAPNAQNDHRRRCHQNVGASPPLENRATPPVLTASVGHLRGLARGSEHRIITPRAGCLRRQ